MKLITERDMIKSVINNFIHIHGFGTYGTDQRGVMVGYELSKLDKATCTTEDVNNLIGRDWVSIKCDDCGIPVKVVVQVGQEPDYESCTANICLDCLKKAVKLIEHTEDRE